VKRKIKKKNNRMKIFNQNGMALLATIIFVSVLISIGIALLAMTNNDTKLSTLHSASNKAFYLADAGIEDTFWTLNTSIVNKELSIKTDDIEDWWSLNGPSPGTANEFYQIDIEKYGEDDDHDPLIRITSTGEVVEGQYSSGKRAIEVTAEIDYIITSMYDYAILSDKIILFQGEPGPVVEGDVHSNDDILCSPANGTFVEEYDGTATCAGDTNELTPSNVDGGTIDIPFVDYDVCESRAIEVHEGDVILGNGETRDWTGIHFIRGSLEAKNGSEIHVTDGAIIATGDVDVKEGAIFDIYNDAATYIDPDDPITALALVAQGDIRIYAKSIIKEGVVESVLADGTAEGFVELKNGCEVTGSIIADTVYLRNKTTVNYPSSGITEITKKGDPFFKKTSWRETY